MTQNEIDSKEYLKNKGWLCPVCKSNQVYWSSGAGYGLGALRAARGVRCNYCKATWDDVFTLSGITSLKEGEAE